MKKVVNALLFRPDGTSTMVTSKGKKFSLAELQELVGGYIERAPAEVVDPEGNVCDMIVNEEGLLIGLLPNTKASRLTGIYLVGNAVLLKKGTW